jgi:hypothetical protein
VEETIDATIAEAFGGSTPNELKRLPFRVRLALVFALTPLPERYAKPIGLLAQLRHDFAHGKVNTLTPARAKSLADAFREVAPEGSRAMFAEPDPRTILRGALMVAYTAIEVGEVLLRERREKEQKALKLQSQLKKLLEEHA